MHVSGISLDLSWFLQFIVTVFVIAVGLLHIVKNTASKYFVVDDTFDPPSSDHNHTSSFRKMPGRPATIPDSCVVCGNSTTKNCAGCKAVRYCSADCQRSHWNSGHKQKCKDLRLSRKANSMQPISLHCGRRGSEAAHYIGNTNIIKNSKEILFPYEEFVDLFNWNNPGFPPCGLLNCGNSCFANVVLQCLSYTKPLVAYLLEKGHRRECRKTDWCFLCELQTHVERASDRRHPFSPLNILSRLPNIGGNLGYGKQEDAHEFMRFAIDTMQSVCLDEFGGERALHPSTQETTLIQHIFGGHLESQVICTKCDNISKQYENMMDLTVEIQGDAASLEECLDQFTVREQLHGDNMYKCDGCNDYVTAWKRLTIRQAPNILTIALKRFQSGRFGKLNKRVTFPETLDLSPYMSEAGHENDVYKLYAVVVHIDMLNASYFGHYICYIKDFSGNWYRIDDGKVERADLEEVLSQGAYMLLYSRICARPSCLKPIEGSSEEQKTAEVIQEEPSAEQSAESSAVTPSVSSAIGSGSLPSCLKPIEGSSEEPKTAKVAQEDPCAEQSAEFATMTTSVSSAIGSESLPSCLKPIEGSSEEQKTGEVVQEEPCAELSTMVPSVSSAIDSASLPSDNNECEEVASSNMELSSTSHSEGFENGIVMMDSDPSSSALLDVEAHSDESSDAAKECSPVVHADAVGVLSSASETLKPEANSNGSALCDSTICDLNSAESSGKELTGSHLANPPPLLGVGSASESSVPVENGMCQKSELSEDVPVSNLRSDVTLDDVNPGKSEEKVTASNSNKDGAGQSAAKSSSRAKPKPLFARGFLENPPRSKCLKRDEKSPSEKGQRASSGDLSNGTSELGSIFQNGFLMKDKGKTHSALKKKQGGVRLENGAVESSKSGKIANLRNGDEGGSSNMDTDNQQP